MLFDSLNEGRVYTHDGKPYLYELSTYGVTEVAIMQDWFEDVEEVSSVKES